MTEKPEDIPPEEEEVEQEDQEEEKKPSDPRKRDFTSALIAFAFMLWFIYDGWIKDPPPDNIMFNRYGAPVLLIVTLYFVVRGLLRKKPTESEQPGDDDKAGPA